MTVANWVERQQSLVDKAVDLPRIHRAKMDLKANRYRKEATYSVGDLVLVHHDRFPARPKAPLDDPWYGPFRIVSAGADSVWVMANPNLGGRTRVHHSYLNAWPELVGEEEVWEEMADEVAAEEDDDPRELPEVEKFEFAANKEKSVTNTRRAEVVPELPEVTEGSPTLELTEGEEVQPHEVIIGRDDYYKVASILGHY